MPREGLVVLLFDQTTSKEVVCGQVSALSLSLSVKEAITAGLLPLGITVSVSFVKIEAPVKSYRETLGIQPTLTLLGNTSHIPGSWHIQVWE